MPWGLAAATVTSIAGYHSAQRQRIATLRAQGRDDEADDLEAALKDWNDFMRQEQTRAYNTFQFRPRIRVNLPTPALLYEAPWWPWLVLELWLQLWVSV